MRTDGSLWFWRGLWLLSFLVGLGVWVLYARLPVDGATGDLESFDPAGFRIQWLLEEREAGLRVGDVVVRAGGHTADEWVSGAPAGPEWRSAGVVLYDILRDGRPAALTIQLTPVSLVAVLQRWAPQLLASLAVLVVGSLVFWRRSAELAARLLMLFCLSVVLQLWLDAFNVQYALLPRPGLFWLHLVLEQGSFTLACAAILHFTLVFPAPHPLAVRFPRLLPLVLYVFNPVMIALVMVLSPKWSPSLTAGNHASLIGAGVLILLALSAGVRSVLVARDPVSRAQIRWIMWGGGVGAGVTLFFYILPLALTGRPLISHPLVMFLTALIPCVLAIAVLRYHLFAIQIIINRTLVYGTLMVLLASLYLLLLRLLTLAIRGLLRYEDDTLVVFVATVSIVLAFAPLRRRVQGAIDRAFYRTKLDYQKLVPEMTARLATGIVPEQLYALLTEELPLRLQVVSSALFVLDPSGEQLVQVGAHAGNVVLPVTHSLAVYLRQLGRPLMRLQAPPQVPAKVHRFLEHHGVELSIPLVVGTELVGLYNLGIKRSRDAFASDEINLLHLLGQQVAIAVENSRLLQAAERQARELAVVHSAAVAVSSSLQMEQVLTRVAEQLGRAIDASNVYICSWEVESLLSTVLAGWADPANPDVASDLGSTYDMRDYPTTLHALQERRPLMVQSTDQDLDPKVRAQAERRGWRSHLVVPFVSRGEVIGYAELWETRRERRFTPAEVRLCQTLAAEAAVAIERARLFEAERRQRELAEALQEAAAVVSSTLNLEQVLDRILVQAARVVAGDAFNIMLIEGSHCRVVRWRGYEPLGVAGRIAGLCIPTRQFNALTTMAQSGRPVLVPDVAVDRDWTDLEGWDWLKSYVGVPIQVAGQIVGFLNVDGTRAAQFGPDDARHLEVFADYAATAIANARLFEDARRRTTYLEAQNAVIAAAVGTSDLPELLEVTLDHTLRALQLDVGYVWVEDWHVGREISPEAGLLVIEAVQDCVQDLAGPIAVGDWQQVTLDSQLEDAASVMADLGIRTSLTVPILAGGYRVGGLVVAAGTPRAWSAEDIALVRAIGRQVGAAAERLRLSYQTREQAQQVQQIISTVPEGVLLLNADRCVLLANPIAQQYLDVLCGARIGDALVHLGGRTLEELLAGPEQSLGHEVMVAGPPRRTFEVAARHLEVGPEVGGWVLLVREVTREREIQEQIQQQDRLAALGQLAGGIAHDFNNLLSIIMMGAESARYEADVPAHVGADLEAILKAGRKGAHLVRQILDFSRRSWIETRWVDLQSVILEVGEILQRTLPENIAVQIEVEPAEYQVEADPARIQQAVMNLALNARDAMPKGGELSIRLRRIEVGPDQELPALEMTPGQWIHLAVSDSGVGISAEVFPHLFEPFFTTKPVGQGTGLGLAQVYGIVKQHQGTVAVDTEVGRGSTFHLYLPLQRVEVTDELASEHVAAIFPRGRGETILLVEDDEDVRRYCQQVLEAAGYRVLGAGNGREALRVYRSSGNVDLLLTDLVMPVMGGRELIEALREIDAGLKVLAMTGYALGDLRDLRGRGVTEILQKPLGLRTLARAVRDVLDST